jgi:orotidine-5'-phosphate decarboxylase
VILPTSAPIAVALDTSDLETAKHWAAAVSPHVNTLKIGLELYLRYGAGAVTAIRECGAERIFLDLKLHDIPATVGAATRSVAAVKPDYLTVHATGGPDVIRAAAQAAPQTKIAAVTVLTSLSDIDLETIGLSGPVRDACRRLAVLAIKSGARAIVCSPNVVSAIRPEVDADITLITPGVRPAGSEADDHKTRIATPKWAKSQGADLLVIGRPITAAPDPAVAAASIAADLADVVR